MNVEDAIIGTLIKESHLLNDITIKSFHFENTQNRRTFDVMRQLQAEGKSVDFVTVLSAGDPRTLGGASRLNDIARLSNPLKIDTYVTMTFEKWREKEKRILLNKAANEDWTINQITTELSALINDQTDDRNSIADLLAAVYEDPWIKKEKPKGIDVGQADLQKITAGWRNGELIIIAARPSIGKSDVMLHLAKSAGWAGCIPIIHSLEMDAERLRDRLIAGVGGYNRSRMQDTYSMLSEEQKSTWAESLKKVRYTNLEIFDQGRQTTAEIRMKTRKIKNENPDKQIIILIDYLTLIKPMNEKNGNVHQQTGDTTKDLKMMAKEFNCPVICLAQLNRGLEQRPNKRPMMSDLRESGSIEEDADVIGFLYRESYYNPDTEDERLMEINIAKQRNGATGVVFVDYDKRTGVIS